MAALDELKKANPDGRFWLKLDGTDVKEGLMESMKGKWNGDVDLLDGKLDKLRKEYEMRVEGLKETTKGTVNPVCVEKIVTDLKEDVLFLSSGLEKARKKYKDKYEKRTTAEEVLKSLSWEVVEHHTLLLQAQELLSGYSESVGNMPVIKELDSEAKIYMRNLFKKKREPADHVLVWMLSDEKRDKKPYALPVGYIPCRTLRDQHVRDLNASLKLEMKKKNLTLAGRDNQ